MALPSLGLSSFISIHELQGVDNGKDQEMERSDQPTSGNR